MSCSPSTALFKKRRSSRRCGAYSHCWRRSWGRPVDLEFASDGQDFYLLQCRPQSYGLESAPTPIPRDIPADRILFTGEPLHLEREDPRHHPLVYVDPEGYGDLKELDQLRDVGRAVGRLNKLLPKRQFILMGPGRWGSRGDIKLGVSVTYSDINNAAVLSRDCPEEGQLRAGPFLRHPLLPGPRGGVDPVPSALPRRRGRRASMSCS